MASLIAELTEMNRLFTGAATSDPISAALLAVGTLLVVASVGVFGYLTLGALVDLLIPDVSRRSPPRAGR